MENLDNDGDADAYNIDDINEVEDSYFTDLLDHMEANRILHAANSTSGNFRSHVFCKIAPPTPGATRPRRSQGVGFNPRLSRNDFPERYMTRVA
mmetsp:Transcript_24126/g.59993  ORF Transcript_24126/g.59993 Transcript_24126/m.59993 type:complete len:94 (-) Transcript_24126:3631-3912(-)